MKSDYFPLPFGLQHQKGEFHFLFFKVGGGGGHWPLPEEASSTAKYYHCIDPHPQSPEVSLKCESGH